MRKTGRLVDHARGRAVRRPRRGDRREHHRALLRLPGGRARAGDRLRRAVPGREARGALPARTSTGCSTPSTGSCGRRNSLTGWRQVDGRQGLHAARPGRGPHRVRTRLLAGRGRRHRRAEPDHRRGRDGQGAGRAAVAVRRARSRSCTPSRARPCRSGRGSPRSRSPTMPADAAARTPRPAADGAPAAVEREPVLVGYGAARRGRSPSHAQAARLRRPPRRRRRPRRPRGRERRSRDDVAAPPSLVERRERPAPPRPCASSPTTSAST